MAFMRINQVIRLVCVVYAKLCVVYAKLWYMLSH
jgi:hypothetical protein